MLWLIYGMRGDTVGMCHANNYVKMIVALVNCDVILKSFLHATPTFHSYKLYKHHLSPTQYSGSAPFPACIISHEQRLKRTD